MSLLFSRFRSEQWLQNRGESDQIVSSVGRPRNHPSIDRFYTRRLVSTLDAGQRNRRVHTNRTHSLILVSGSQFNSFYCYQLQSVNEIVTHHFLSPSGLEFRRTLSVRTRADAESRHSLSCPSSYPYYGMRLLKQQNRLLTWLRYTLWIVLYPIGAFLEG
jgi:hypothetical protein